MRIYVQYEQRNNFLPSLSGQGTYADWVKRRLHLVEARNCDRFEHELRKSVNFLRTIQLLATRERSIREYWLTADIRRFSIGEQE